MKHQCSIVVVSAKITTVKSLFLLLVKEVIWELGINMIIAMVIEVMHASCQHLKENN